MVVCALALATWTSGAQGQSATMDEAFRLMRNGDYDAAIELLERYTQENPEDARALGTLANAHHAKGEYEIAIELNRRAAKAIYMRPTALYNEACALSLLGRVDDAHNVLLKSIEAGFLDYDHLENDPDLMAVRKEHRIQYPPGQTYETLLSGSGVAVDYKVLRPGHFDHDLTYPVLVIFGPGGGRRSTDWAMAELVSQRDDTRGWIIVYPVSPEGGWFTHQAHQAFNELMDKLRDDYNVEGEKFHTAGFGRGASVATTYSIISEQYFQTLTTFSGWHWVGFDDDRLVSDFGDIAVRLVVGGEDTFGREMNTRVRNVMYEGGVDVRLSVVEKDDHMLTSVRPSRIIDYIPRGGNTAY
jgi:tetratricopeptide (TPR) repeat protein